MRGEANQNVPAISKQAVVGLIVFIANRFFSFSFRVGKRRDRSKERSLRRGIRRGPIANSSEELSKGDRATCMKPSKCSPQTFKNHNLGYQNRSQVAAKTLWGTLGALRCISERAQGGWLWDVLRTSENGVQIRLVDDIFLMMVFLWFFCVVLDAPGPEIVAPVEANR